MTDVRRAAPRILRRLRAAPRQRGPTVEDKLRADFEADKIDALDFALAVDACDDLDAPVAVIESKRGRRVLARKVSPFAPGPPPFPGALWHTPSGRWLNSNDSPGGYRPLPPALEMADLTRRIHRQRVALTDLQRRIDIVTAREARAMIELCENGHIVGKKP